MNKPVMIAESTPFGGIPMLDDPWQDWFEPILDLIDANDIAMWSFINCDWTSQPMWRGVGFGNTRLAVNGTVMRLWREHVIRNSRFLQYGKLKRYCAPNQIRRNRQRFHNARTVGARIGRLRVIPGGTNINIAMLTVPEREWAEGTGLLALTVIVILASCRLYDHNDANRISKCLAMTNGHFDEMQRKY